MAQQCPELAHVLAIYNPIAHTGKLTTRKESTYSHKDSANPLLLQNIQCFTPLHQDATLQAVNNSALLPVNNLCHSSFDMDQNLILPPLEQVPLVQLLAIAAPELKGKKKHGATGKHYDSSILEDFFNNIYAGFSLTKQADIKQEKRTHLVSGKLGAGVFGHSVEVSLTLQYAAALLAEIDFLTWMGLGNNEIHTEKVHQKAQDNVTKYLNSNGGNLEPRAFIEWLVSEFKSKKITY